MLCCHWAKSVVKMQLESYLNSTGLICRSGCTHFVSVIQSDKEAKYRPKNIVDSWQNYHGSVESSCIYVELPWMLNAYSMIMHFEYCQHTYNLPSVASEVNNICHEQVRLKLNEIVWKTTDILESNIIGTTHSRYNSVDQWLIQNIFSQLQYSTIFLRRSIMTGSSNGRKESDWSWG